MVIEVDPVEARCERAVEKGLPIQQKSKDQEWDHRNVCVRDPTRLLPNYFKDTRKE